MRERSAWYLVTWLLVVAVGYVAALLKVWRFFVQSVRGQSLDAIGYAGAVIGRRYVLGPSDLALELISVLSLTVAVIVVGFIAAIRGRMVLTAAAVLLVAGANVTTQVLKYRLDRPDLDTGYGGYEHNSLPSGHTTVAASVAVALVLVLPPRLRGPGAVLASAYTAFVGIATVAEGWHRPSDAVAALLIVGGWAALAGLVLVLFQREVREATPPADPATAAVRRGEGHPVVAGTLMVTGIALLVVAAVSLGLTDHVVSVPTVDLSRRRLFIAYAGSAAGIGGTVAVTMALVVATVHRLVPNTRPRADRTPR